MTMAAGSRAILGGVGLALAGVGYLHAQAAGIPAARPAAPRAQAAGAETQVSNPGSPQRALLDRYCVTCHNETLKTAGLTLDTLDVSNVGDAPEVWEKVVFKLRGGMMPPVGRPRPDQQAYDDFASWLETELDRAAEGHVDPGRVPTHRLNRAEYTNAIRDLLALDVDGESLLPADSADHGFDNIASALAVSPALLERYMSAARRISRLAVGDPTIGPALGSQTYAVPIALMQHDRMSEDLSFGSRGGMAIRHHFPLDGEYVVKVRLRRTVYDFIVNLHEPHDLEVRLDGKRIVRWTVGGAPPGKPAPLSFSGNIVAAGEGVVYPSPDWEEYMTAGDKDLEVRFPVEAGTRVVGVSFVAQSWEREGVFQPRLREYAPSVTEVTDTSTDSNSRPEGPAMESVTIEGPYDAAGAGETPSRDKIFVCHPSDPSAEEPCATTILSMLARRAYRRPVTEVDVQRLLGFYRAGRTAGGFEAGIQAALERMLVSPQFLFRIERDPDNVAPGTIYRLSDLELASRLSFFLWSSIPDEELLAVAARGELSDPAVLDAQVGRMLADARADALVENFASQWLTLRSLRGAYSDPNLFPDFDDNLREAFRRETELFVEHLIREDRSVVELLSANYTFLNEQLARHYQVPNVYGSHFRLVPLSDTNRGGLLGQASILMVTSYGNRTSPVLRAKWLLENILGTPPPPPPPDVPPFPDEQGEDGKPRSVRERLAQHRKNPACAVCHAPMDPLGFALENFDAIGKWRTTDANTPVDASAELPDGTRFTGPVELRAVLLERRDQFVHTVTEKLLTYALGRGLEYYDRPVIRHIAREAASDDYRWSSLILGVVKSTPFHMRRSES